MLQDIFERILKARVYDVAIESPLEPARRLSARLGNQVLFKREDLQPVFSFKLRGAFNRIARLTSAEAARGVICASAGNHAQGVALAARRRGIRAVICMPRTTPAIKVEAVQSLGGEVVLHGDDYDSACAQAMELAAAEGLVFIHPFDDPEVIAGQGTIAMELLRQHGPDIEAVFIPIGGGGLVAGIGTYLHKLHPGIRIIGVEPVDAASMKLSLDAGRRVTLPRVGLFHDGVAVRTVGEHTFKLAQQVVDEVMLVTTDETCAAIQDIYEDTRSIVEPAGALAVAALKQYVAREGVTGKTFVTLNCGANMNFDRLRHVTERAELGARREALFAVEIPEQPGSFLRFCRLLGERSVTEFNYRYAPGDTARIFVGLAVPNGLGGKDELQARIEAGGFPVTDVSDNELAKLHVRYMVGGHAPDLLDERLFRFEFPERPGALLRFLEAIGSDWNISLFHYRNHGSSSGRVLAGIQVPAASAASFAEHLRELDYQYTEETGNPAARLFLA